MKTLRTFFVQAICLFFTMTVLCGILYPLAITGIARLAFHHKSKGSIITVNGSSYGSHLLGQPFIGDRYLWGRVAVYDFSSFQDQQGQIFYYAAPSNKSPASEEYQQMIAQRVEALRIAHPDKNTAPIPVDLVTGSASGLDPHISPAAAAYQVERIAAARKLSADQVHEIIAQSTTGRLLGILGEPVVNVLEVNLRLDGILQPDS